MRRTAAQGGDSLVGEYSSPALRLGFDYGWYSDPLDYEGRPGYQEGVLEIDGKRAKYVTFRKPDAPPGRAYFAGVHFADLGAGQDRLTVWANCRNSSDLELVKKVFQSIKFL